MKRALLSIAALLLSSTLSIAAERPPNILFILADDLGYGDVGVFYQNAREAQHKPAFVTPNIDALAKSGVMLMNHYCAAPVCAPSRASLITGQSQGHCAIRDNQFDKPLPDDVLTLPELLKQANYHTIAVGKWGIGGHAKSGWPAHPMRRGFDDFFGFMLHKSGHTYYHDAEHPLMDGLEDVGAKYENVYSTDLFTARAKKFIVDHENAHPDQPFFMYLAYTAVHNALDIPGGAYPSGAGKSGGEQWPVAPTPKTRNTWIHPDYASQPWSNHMKRYATMARRLDDGVHDVLQLLQDLHIANDTLVVFTSDNGPANEGGADPRLFDSWGPFDGFKRDCFEGGVREPTIVAWPGHITPGRTSDAIGIQYDWMDTLADLAHLPLPAQCDGVSLLPALLNNQPLARPYIYGEYDYADKWKQSAAADVRARKAPIRGQQQFVRIGDYVGVRTHITNPDTPLRLYNVSTDPHQDHNIAKDPAQATLLARMTEILTTARRPDRDAKRPYDDAPMPADSTKGSTAGQLAVSTFDGSWPWTPDFRTMNPSNTSTSAGIKLPATPPDHPFGLEFTGYLSVPKDGTYTFTAKSDHTLHLWLHDAHVIDADHAAADHPLTATVNLRAGQHPIRVAYTHQTGAPVLELHYSGPDTQDQSIPPSSLSSPSRNNLPPSPSGRGQG